MPAPKPNPLDHRQAAEAEAAPLLLDSDGAADGAAAVSTRRPSLQSNESRPSKPRRVDTSALTGVRGLAAMHVAVGHMFSFSTLRLDLIGGAASESPAVMSSESFAIAAGSAL